MDSEKQRPSAVFSIKGFKAGINDDKQSYTFEIAAGVVDVPIESITLSKKSKDTDVYYECTEINNAEVKYKFGTVIDEKILAVTKKFIENFLLVFIAEKEISTNNIRVKILSYTVPEKNQINVHLYERLSIRDDVQIFQLYGSDNYKSIFDDEILTDKNVEADLEILKSTYDVENIRSRYMFQYEFLKHLLAELYGKDYGSQILVQEFVADKYNTQATELFKIKMTKSLLNPNKDQDYLTYYRNVIGHPAVTENEKNVFAGIDLEQTIAGYSKRLSTVILFAIREKKRLAGNTY